MSADNGQGQDKKVSSAGQGSVYSAAAPRSEVSGEIPTAEVNTDNRIDEVIILDAHLMKVKELGKGSFGEVNLYEYVGNDSSVLALCKEYEVDGHKKKYIAVKNFLSGRVDEVECKNIKNIASKCNHENVNQGLVARSESGNVLVLSQLASYGFNRLPITSDFSNYIEKRRNIIKESGRSISGEMFQFIQDMHAGQVALHQAGLLHLDTACRNFLVYEDSAGQLRLRISDFGLSARYDLTRLNAVGMQANAQIPLLQMDKDLYQYGAFTLTTDHFAMRTTVIEMLAQYAEVKDPRCLTYKQLTQPELDYIRASWQIRVNAIKKDLSSLEHKLSQLNDRLNNFVTLEAMSGEKWKELLSPNDRAVLKAFNHNSDLNLPEKYENLTPTQLDVLRKSWESRVSEMKNTSTSLTVELQEKEKRLSTFGSITEARTPEWEKAVSFHDMTTLRTFKDMDNDGLLKRLLSRVEDKLAEKSDNLSLELKGIIEDSKCYITEVPVVKWSNIDGKMGQSLDDVNAAVEKDQQQFDTFCQRISDRIRLQDAYEGSVVYANHQSENSAVRELDADGYGAGDLAASFEEDSLYVRGMMLATNAKLDTEDGKKMMTEAVTMLENAIASGSDEARNDFNAQMIIINGYMNGYNHTGEKNLMKADELCKKLLISLEDLGDKAEKGQRAAVANIMLQIVREKFPLPAQGSSNDNEKDPVNNMPILRK